MRSLDLTLLLLEACRTGTVTCHTCRTGATKTYRLAGMGLTKAEYNARYSKENRAKISAQKKARYRAAKLNTSTEI